LLGYSGSTLDIKSLILGNAGQRYTPGSFKIFVLGVPG
jgi:hypothetical protein